jgi:hypothetical protein
VVELVNPLFFCVEKNAVKRFAASCMNMDNDEVYNVLLENI